MIYVHPLIVIMNGYVGLLFVIGSIIPLNGQFVKIRLTSQVIYRQDSLKIECLEDGLTNKDSIYGFVLTKKIGDVTSDVVKVAADPTNPPYYQKIVWSDSSFQSRASVDGTELVPTSSSKFVLSINASEVSCKDSAMFTCKVVVSGERSGHDSAQLNVVVASSNVGLKDVTPNRKLAYYPNDKVQLECKSTFSTPACLRWCIKRQTEEDFSEYRNNYGLNTSEISYDGCQYYRHSRLKYNVTKDDTKTIFACEGATTPSCKIPNADRKTIIIGSEPVDLVTIDVPSKLLYKRQSFPIGCYSKPLRDGAVISSLSLYKVIDNTVNLLVGAIYDNVTMRTTTVWRDRDFKQRSKIMTSNINPMMDATLSIEIATDKVRCWDASTYRCELALGGKKFSVQQNTVTVLSTAQYVETKINSPVALTRKSALLQCLTSYFEPDDTIVEIILFKLEHGILSRIVTAQLDLTSGGFTTQVKWEDLDWKSRGTIISASVFPVTTANITIQIPVNKLRCADAGKFVCKVSSLGDKHGESASLLNITVKSSDDFAVTSVTPVASNNQYRKGDTLVIKCGGMVGNPPEVPTWCRKTYSESSFSLYTSNDMIAVTSLTPQECQFERFSILEYKVADIDSNTEFKCIPSYKKCSSVSSTRPFIIKNTKTGTNPFQQCPQCPTNCVNTCKPCQRCPTESANTCKPCQRCPLCPHCPTEILQESTKCSPCENCKECLSDSKVKNTHTYYGGMIAFMVLWLLLFVPLSLYGGIKIWRLFKDKRNEDHKSSNGWSTSYEVDG